MTPKYSYFNYLQLYNLHFKIINAIVEFDPYFQLLRLENRSGLIRARMAGIELAKKDTILLFLDSHIEATPGWIEPLLARIKENPKVRKPNLNQSLYVTLQLANFLLIVWTKKFALRSDDFFSADHQSSN